MRQCSDLLVSATFFVQVSQANLPPGWRAFVGDVLKGVAAGEKLELRRTVSDLFVVVHPQHDLYSFDEPHHCWRECSTAAANANCSRVLMST